MLTVILNQLSDQVFRLKTSDHSVELTEFENEFENEDKLAYLVQVKIEIGEVNTEKSFITIAIQWVQFDGFRKIPVPPPEFG